MLSPRIALCCDNAKKPLVAFFEDVRCRTRRQKLFRIQVFSKEAIAYECHDTPRLRKAKDLFSYLEKISQDKTQQFV